jgi:hypothetical protein
MGGMDGEVLFFRSSEIQTLSRRKCAVSNDLDALAQLLDQGIVVGGVLRLIGLVRNGAMDLWGLGDLQLSAGIRVADSAT